MGKRKVSEAASEEPSESEEYTGSESSESEVKSRKNKSAKAKPSVKKPVIKKEQSSDDESESDRPVAKKSRREATKAAPSGASSSVKVLKNKDGEKYIDLGKKKHATIRTFKGMDLLDIREFYDAGGEAKPGKKGISLNLAQWNALKAATETIDQLFTDLKK